MWEVVLEYLLRMTISIDEFNGFIADTEDISLQDILDAQKYMYLLPKTEDHKLKVISLSCFSVLRILISIISGKTGTKLHTETF